MNMYNILKQGNNQHSCSKYQILKKTDSSCLCQYHPTFTKSTPSHILYTTCTIAGDRKIAQDWPYTLGRNVSVSNSRASKSKTVYTCTGTFSV